MEAKKGRIHPNFVSNRVNVTLNHSWKLLKFKYFWNIWILNLISLKWKMMWICAAGFHKERISSSPNENMQQWLSVVQLKRVFSCASEFRSRITWRTCVVGRMNVWMSDQMNELHIVYQMLKLELFNLNLCFIFILKWATDQVIYFTTYNYREDFKPHERTEQRSYFTVMCSVAC